MGKYLFFVLLFVFLGMGKLPAQLVLNEFQLSNISGITDEDGNHSDWIELYNASDNLLNLSGYSLSDKRDTEHKWVFPDVSIQPRSHFLVFASGKDRNGVAPRYRTIIRRGDSWRYFASTSLPSGTWRTQSYNDSHWKTGPSGFGYGDNDDATELLGSTVIILRKEFQVDNPALISEMLLHVDYDDGFVAYINGQMVAMAGVSEHNDDFSSVEVSGHEAVMYTGGQPEKFDISSAIPTLVRGTNLIVIQGHNIDSGSTDFSLIPFLTLGSESFATNDAESFIPVSDGSLHSDFKLSKEGEAIYLWNTSSQIIDSSVAILVPDDASYGRFPDGGSSWAYFTEPTPGAVNSNPSDQIVRDSVFFSYPSGYYTKPFELNISHRSVSEGQIRFTTDGSVPDKNSSLYFGPIQISATTVVRAAWVGNEGVDNPVITSTYIFEEPSGLPVISLSTDPKNFFDWYEGILVDGPNASPDDPHYGANYWMDWEKPVFMEYFNANSQLKIAQGAGVQVTGNWSRANPQKSLALFARKEFGKGSFDYPFFSDRPNQSYESFILRNSGNDWWYTMFRDGLSSEIARDMNMERLAFQPTRVYLNGEYWGILNMREKPNEHYFFDNYGVKEENLLLLENNGSVIQGSSQEYNKLRNIISVSSLEEESKYARVCSMLDIECFIDYQILEIFIDNRDWPGNNIKFWKAAGDAGRWRYLLFDSDFGYNIYGANGNTLEFATEPYGPSWPNPPWSTLFLRKLLVNNDFKNQFITRFSDCLNSTFLVENLTDKVDSIVRIISREIPSHLGRWYFDYENWKMNVSTVKSFIYGRRADMREYIREYFGFDYDKLLTISLSEKNSGKIRANTIIPGSYPFQGYYFSEVPVTIEALPNPGYRFVRWGGSVSSNERVITFSMNANFSITAYFEPVTSVEEQVVINEINYKSPNDFDSGDWIELYNNGSQTVDLSGWVLADEGDPEKVFVFSNGTYLYPGQYLVVASKISTFRSVFPSIRNVIGDLSFGLSGSGETIWLYNNSGVLIDQVRYDIRTPWSPLACGFGPSLELKSPSLDNALGNNWGTGEKGGTPGRVNAFTVDSKQLVQQKGFAICYPTVFTHQTTLQFFDENAGNYSVQVLDLQGRLYETITGQSIGGNTSVNLFINSEKYTTGIYLIKLQTTGWTEILKVVKR